MDAYAALLDYLVKSRVYVDLAVEPAGRRLDEDEPSPEPSVSPTPIVSVTGNVTVYEETDAWTAFPGWTVAS